MRSLGSSVAAGMIGLDDLCIVDALPVERRDAEIAVAQLTLDDDERHALPRELDGMGVPELVRGEAPADACFDGRLAQICSRGGG
jgi:hypothetical protein